MKAQELRIGNIIRIEYDAFDYEVIEIRRNALELDSEKGDKHINSISFSSCKPIPLTEDWLVKFGFVKNTDEYYEIQSSNGDHVFLDDFQNGWCVSVPYITFVSHTPPIANADGSATMASSEAHYAMINNNGIKGFVHELQNLYFALTGEELKLKE